MSRRKTAMRWLLRSGFVLALGLTLFFGVRTVLSALYWGDPRHNDQVIEPWMPVGYVGRSWDVPRAVMLEGLGLDPSGLRRASIAQIAESRGIPVDALITQIMAVIEAHRQAPHD